MPPSRRWLAFLCRGPSNMPTLGEGPSAADKGKLGSFNALRHRVFGNGPRRELVKRLDLANHQTIPEAYGSGVAIDNRGLVLTNFHVIDGATKIYVRFPGTNRGSYADIQAADCAIRSRRSETVEPARRLEGNSVRRRRTRFAWAIGLSSSPIRLRQVSRMANRAPRGALFRTSGARCPARPTKPNAPSRSPIIGTLIETDARINLGCSGGALLNLKWRTHWTDDGVGRHCRWRKGGRLRHPDGRERPPNHRRFETRQGSRVWASWA